MSSSKMNHLLPILLVAALTAGCGSESKEKASEPEGAPVAVRTMTVQPTALPGGMVATGTVRSRTSSTIASKVMGYVRAVHAEVGDLVPAGKLLVELDASDLDAGVRQAQAAVAEARTARSEVEQAIAAAKANRDLSEATYRRMKDLFDKKSVTNQEFDEASARRNVAVANLQGAESKRSQVEARVAQAEAALTSAQVMKGYASIRAPFAGVVTEKTVEPGNLAAPGQPLLTIEQASAYRLEVPVEESKMGQISPGQKVSVSLEALDRSLDATVTELVPAVDAASRTFIVRINLPGGLKVRSGMFGRATFATGTRQALVVPADAVQSRGQVQGVFAVENGRVRLRLVSLGEASDGGREVLSGLQGGEVLVSPVPTSLQDGARVEVRP